MIMSRSHAQNAESRSRYRQIDGSASGIGETGLPPLAPAIRNAVVAAAGKRLLRPPLGVATLAGRTSHRVEIC
jgi:CO/xanthine dehydrogenase Mo-binding subunit